MDFYSLLSPPPLFSPQMLSTLVSTSREQPTKQMKKNKQRNVKDLRDYYYMCDTVEQVRERSLLMTRILRFTRSPSLPTPTPECSTFRSHCRQHRERSCQTTWHRWWWRARVRVRRTMCARMRRSAVTTRWSRQSATRTSASSSAPSYSLSLLKHTRRL